MASELYRPDLNPDRISRPKSPLAQGWDALLLNWKPFLLIQACAFALVVFYHQSPWFQGATVGIGHFKTQGGLLFSAVANAIAGAILPQIAKRLAAPTSPRPTVKDIAFQLVFFAVLGIFVDVLYSTLAVLIGTDSSIRTVLTKLAIDQLVFSTLISIPFSVICYLWRDTDFSFSKTGHELKSGAFGRRYAPLIISCWGYWVPCALAVYTMPPSLQFCLFLCENAAWSLLLVTLGTRHKKAA